MSRTRQVSEAFVELSDWREDGFTAAELWGRLVKCCVALLGLDNATLLLPDESGQLLPLAADGVPAPPGPAVHTRTLALHADSARPGQLLLTSTGPAALEADSLTLARALIRVAVATSERERALRESRQAVDELQELLSGRIVLEQVKGMLAERCQISPDEALARLRAHATAHDLRLFQLARQLADGSVHTGALHQPLPPAPAPGVHGRT
jgi:ANTAR domain